MNWQETVMNDETIRDKQISGRPWELWRLRKVAEAQAIISFKAGEKKARREATIAMNELVNKVAAREHRAGQEEERKKWIKEAIKAGILISKPEELAGIITTSLADICLKHRKAEAREVMEWVENMGSPRFATLKEWEAFKKKRE